MKLPPLLAERHRNLVSAHAEQRLEAILHQNLSEKSSALEAHHVRNQGDHQAVVPLGKIEGVEKWPAVLLKFLKMPPGNGHRNQVKVQRDSVANAVQQEMNAKIFLRLCFPALPHTAIAIGGTNVYAVATPEAAPEDWHKVEAHDFDFSSLKNGLALKAEFEKYVAGMNDMFAREELKADDHITQDNPDTAFRKTFLVCYPPDTKAPEGYLVMADLDHVHLKDSIFRQPRFGKYLKYAQELVLRLINKGN